MQMIKVSVSTKLGGIYIAPIHPTDCDRISATNHYDGSFDVFLQGDSQEVLKEIISADDYAEVESGWQIVVELDDYTYRHLVGGQKD